MSGRPRYVFAHHFSGQGTAQALDLYRSGYRPSPEHPEPRTFLTVNVVVAETREEAEALAAPNLASMVALRTGGPLAPQALVEDAQERGIEYLGALPLDMSIRVQADGGQPTVVADPDGKLAGIYKDVARKVAVRIAGKAKDFSSKFPTITISKNT